jgi:glycosyltransferase involved in cell wall biosynthesis
MLFKKPYFSIIIPTLNEEKFLPLLLTNLTQQTYTNFEVIVVDANSTDKTKDIALKFKTKLNLRFISSSKTQVSYQRNLGGQNAKAKILIFFDADTQIPKNFLKKIKLAFDTKNPDILTTWNKSDSKLDKDKVIAIATNILFELAKFINFPALYGAMIAVKKPVFKAVNGFSEKVKFGEDSYFVQQVVRAGYKYIILRNAYYIFSLRRFRKEGTLNTLRQYAQLNSKILLNGFESKPAVDYPMGGHLFTNSSPTKPSLAWMQKTLSQLKKALKPKSKKTKSALRQFIDQLMEEVKTPH